MDVLCGKDIEVSCGVCEEATGIFGVCDERGAVDVVGSDDVGRKWYGIRNE